MPITVSGSQYIFLSSSSLTVTAINLFSYCRGKCTLLLFIVSLIRKKGLYFIGLWGIVILPLKTKTISQRKRFHIKLGKWKCFSWFSLPHFSARGREFYGLKCYLKFYLGQLIISLFGNKLLVINIIHS